MPKFSMYMLAAVLCATATQIAGAQQLPGGPRHFLAPYAASSANVGDVDFPHTTQLPRMAPELALQVFSQRSVEQAQKLAAYTDTTIVQAELPDTSQRGEYELLRTYTAPKSLNFATIKFTGDNFVKSNVIVRLLQQEVERVEKGDAAKTAITEQNYKFSYKGVETVEGDLCHVFQLKPRRKAVGLFKGRILLEVHTGSLRRAEGTFSKSPSFFVRKIEFVQDFADFAGVTLPTHLRSTAKARIIGRTIVNVFHRGYQLTASAVKPTAAPNETNSPALILSPQAQ
ncbi:MAG TPA: hypothetical protein VN622_11285 [Clostridia bacterium]|nr:hypothetical protein [Clostridia bacterium]